jgi:protein MpaA
VRHRPIVACERGAHGGPALLVIGVIHGDERVGLGVVSRLMSAPVPYGVDLWVIPTVNPDGLAADTRGNARGVDENRNWPYHWAASTPGSSTYGGPSPWSEPETRALAGFLARLRPHTVVIMHTPLDAVDYSEGADRSAVDFLAARSGYPARTLGARPGELTGWYNAQAWQPSAITFEFGRTATTAQLDQVTRALLELAAFRAR